MKGKVKFYNRSKDFGFIAGEAGAEYYFNAASMKMPKDNDPVEFETHKTARGEVARMVVPAVAGASSAAVSGKACKAPCKRGVCLVGLIIAFAVGVIIGHFI
jgi:cold shock CspA family protein